MLSRLHVNTNIFVASVLVCSTASKNAYNYVWRITYFLVTKVSILERGE
jgi:hypothetical protein